jgi:hypothetical protein
MKTLAAACLLATTGLAGPAFALTFIPGDLVVAVEGNGVVGAPANTATFGDNQAAPLTLLQYTTSGVYVGSEVLPTTPSGSNSAISGEYGSSSEGLLQLSGNGAYLTIVGYGVNYAQFNADPTAYGTLTTDPSKSTALGQSGSLTVAAQKAAGLTTAQQYTPVPRVVALINQDGVVNTQTAVYNVFNGNNPRSAYTATGATFYISGQGNSPDATGGVFYLAKRGATASPTPITGLDTSANTAAQDTRFVTVYDNTLYVSTDSKEGSGDARSFVGTLGSPPSTSLYDAGGGPTMLTGFGNTGGTGKVTITTATSNGVNSKGQTINLSPEEYFFADDGTVLYVADSGDGKQTSGSSSLGDGGLQKWVDVSGTWTLEYTLGLKQGLPLVANTVTTGADTTTGLFAITGEVDPNNPSEEELFVTTYSDTDTGETYLYEITDTLSNTTAPGTTTGGVDFFNLLATAPADSNFKGVSFAPTTLEALATPEPAAWVMMLVGVGLTGARVRRRRGHGASPAT